MAESFREFLRCYVRARPWTPELALFVVVLVLSFGALQGDPFSLDVPLGEAIQSWQLPLLDPVLHGVSAIGWFRIAAPTTIAVVVLLGVLGWRQEAVVLAAAALFGHLLNQALKALIARPRPALPAEEMAALGVDTFAFPSGHAQSFTIFYGFLALLFWQNARQPWVRGVGAACMLTMIALVGISRVYLGVHWPSDVIGAYCIGILWLQLWTRAQRAWSAARGHRGEESFAPGRRQQ